MPTSQRRKTLLHGTPDEIRALIAEDAAKRQRDPASQQEIAVINAEIVIPERLKDLYDALHDHALLKDPGLQAIRTQVNAVRADPALLQAARDTPEHLRSAISALALLP